MNLHLRVITGINDHHKIEAMFKAFSKALDEAIASKRPCVIDCAVDENEFVLPMLPPGGCIDNIITHVGG